MVSPKPSLILPVESQVRELDAKLLLACVAAERGMPAPGSTLVWSGAVLLVLGGLALGRLMPRPRR